MTNAQKAAVLDGLAAREWNPAVRVIVRAWADKLRGDVR